MAIAISRPARLAAGTKKRPTATAKLSRHDFFHAITTNTAAAAAAE